MKQGGLKVVSLILAVLLLGVVAYADDITQNIVSQVIESFDDADAVGWSWKAEGSKFSAEGYPKVKLFSHVPLALRSIYKDPNKDYKVLGLEMKFDRQGDNWVDVYPVDPDGNRIRLPFPGVISRFDLWAWGANVDFYLQVLLEDPDGRNVTVDFEPFQDDFKTDYKLKGADGSFYSVHNERFGRTHTLDMGSLHFQGWKNMAVNIPTSIRQTQNQLPRYQGLRLVGLRIRSLPTEYANRTYKLFFDQIKILTDMFETMYDGYELVDQDFDANSGL